VRAAVVRQIFCARFDKTPLLIRQSMATPDWRDVVTDTILKRFDRPDVVRTFEKGRFEVVQIAGLTLGRATYEPGWKW
jgi:hypothetical protein